VTVENYYKRSVKDTLRRFDMGAGSAPHEFIGAAMFQSSTSCGLQKLTEIDFIFA
jgi:hypothetical protein